MKHLAIYIIFINLLYAYDIDELSGRFLDTPYKANTLIGGIDQKEQMVVSFENFDCFTFIDTIEALKDDRFKSALRDIRYKNGIIDYKNRNHFFSDWKVYNKNIKDITCDIGSCKKVTKKLNKKDKNSVYLKGIDIVKRDIYYTTPDKIEFSKLKSGDYIGIYTTLKGLDVTHVGLAVNKNGIWYLRHASSKMKKVVDSNLKDYIKNKTGVLIYRSKK